MFEARLTIQECRLVDLYKLFTIGVKDINNLILNEVCKRRNKQQQKFTDFLNFSNKELYIKGYEEKTRN